MKLPTAFLVSLVVLVAAASPGAAPEGRAAAPVGQVTWGVHTTLVPTYFDPAETMIVTPFMVMYALHDGLVKPMPGKSMAPSLAESWSVSPDGLVYEFVLRKGVKFHNGEPVTAEDVKFSFERYRGASHRTLKENVEKVGDEGYKKMPIGAGPYRFVSFTPGVELVLEAFDQYWRKAPSVKRLVLKAIPDEVTRLAALKRGEVDVAYAIRGALAEDLRRTPGLTLRPNVGQATFWVYFADQWDPKSPWHDRRVRLAASLAIDRPAINQAETLGFSKITWSIIPTSFEFYWQPPAFPHDPARARQLLTEAGYPNGLDAGDYSCDAAISNIGEAVVNYLKAVGIRVKLRPLERAAFFKGYAEKKYRGLIQGGSGVFGNAATRIEAFVASGGTYVYGGYADIDGLFREQAAELDPKRREATLHRIQQLIHEKVLIAPIWLNAGLNGVGPRVEESGIGVIAGYAFSAPYEDVKLK